MNKRNFLSFLCLVTISLLVFIFISLRPQNPHLPLPATQAESAKALQAGQNPQKSQTTTLIAVGDIMLGRYVNIQTQKNKDWRYPFLRLTLLTSSADITFGNLEAPFVQNCPSTSVGMIFCAPPPAVEGLKFAGFDILSIANNHILNYGQEDLEQTKSLLSSANILYSPPNSLNPLTSLNSPNNLSIGFLSFDLVTYPNSPVIKLVQENADKVDFLIVSLHWGAEYSPKPSNQQINLAHQIIDSGAKVIIGHHPHVIQPTESYHNGLIFYSLGNFVFDQPWSEETKKGKIAKIVFEGKNIQSYEEIPIYIENNSQPVLLP